MTMLERMSKAIIGSRCRNPDELWNSWSKENQQLYINEAKAALTALLEPTPRMILEGAKASADQHYKKGQVWEREGFLSKDAKEDFIDGAIFGFRAMITAALNEEDGK